MYASITISVQGYSVHKMARQRTHPVEISENAHRSGVNTDSGRVILSIQYSMFSMASWDKRLNTEHFFVSTELGSATPPQSIELEGTDQCSLDFAAR